MSIISTTRRGARGATPPPRPEQVRAADDPLVAAATAKLSDLRRQLEEIEGAIDAAPGRGNWTVEALRAEAAAVLAGEPLTDRPKIDLDALRRKQAVLEHAIKLQQSAIGSETSRAAVRIREAHVPERAAIVKRIADAMPEMLEALRELWTFNYRLDDVGPYGAPLGDLAVGPATNQEQLGLLIAQLERFPDAALHIDGEGWHFTSNGGRR